MSTEDAETLKLLWKPNLEIYGLQEFKKHNILSEMAGLRVSRSKGSCQKYYKGSNCLE